ncbi:MAG: 4-(cytidine 5'-diphospho)-2-C-methyl-D-erythritol kinase [Clostridiaceae bacterium]|jgi:4-diphosphocytidyl-2-C-methyl-D-erythritol kinase|nr:4-(cytidine 5'-diphospho)-2-C-methyl-D-erythritol kinase [Clostridiaceae bacterium]
MSYIEIPAYAKINLSLDVIRRREDGYHELRMIMQTVSLHDTVCLESAGEAGIRLECDTDAVPCDRTNTAWRAAELMFGQYNLAGGLRIRIIKRIPAAAGLAGGSTDAAAVLKGINELYALGLDTGELKRLGLQIGADVPYCIEGGTRLAEGIGEILTPLPDLSGIDVVIVKPHIKVSTPWVYSQLDLSQVTEHDRPDTEKLTEALANRDLKAASLNMKNVLELVTMRRYEIISYAKSRMAQAGAEACLMSGSGPSVFGLFAGPEKAQEAYAKLSAHREWECFIARTV